MHDCYLPPALAIATIIFSSDSADDIFEGDVWSTVDSMHVVARKGRGGSQVTSQWHIKIVCIHAPLKGPLVPIKFILFYFHWLTAFKITYLMRRGHTQAWRHIQSPSIDAIVSCHAQNLPGSLESRQTGVTRCQGKKSLVHVYSRSKSLSPF